MHKLLILLIPAILVTACSKHQQDYVSGYDWQSARLVDLPWEMGRTLIGTGDRFDYDDYVRNHHSNWSYIEHALGYWLFTDKSYIPKSSTNHVYTVDDPQSIVPQYIAIDHQSCRLKDGMYWYELHVGDGVVQARTSWKGHAPQLRLTVLGMDDYNHDGFMDVKMKRELSGSARPQEVLVVSRKSPDGRFYVVEHLESDVRL